MKKTLITLLILSLAYTGTMAQQKGMKGKHSRKSQSKQMAAQLNLTEQQRSQTRTYRMDAQKKLKELNKLENITVKEQRDRREAIRKDQRAKMNGLLTAEQNATKQRLMAERKARANVQYDQRLGKMKTKLNLTETQVVQMKKLREDRIVKTKSIRENGSLSREDRKAKMMALKSEMKEQRSKLFTAEQQKKIEELRKNRIENKPAK